MVTCVPGLPSTAAISSRSAQGGFTKACEGRSEGVALHGPLTAQDSALIYLLEDKSIPSSSLYNIPHYFVKKNNNNN